MNKIAFGMMLAALLASALASAFHAHAVDASETVYIRADGSIDPFTAPISTMDNATYILTGNIISEKDGIVVERDNIIVDGAGFTVEGNRTNYMHGIYLYGRNNVTIQNTNIKNFGDGIWLASSTNNNINANTIVNNNCGIWLGFFSNSNSINGNNVTDNEFGIRLQSSSDISMGENTVANNGEGIWLYSFSNNNRIDHNTIANNSYYGIWLESSSNNSINDNTFVDDGLYVWYSFSNSVKNNTVNGRPMVYLEGVTDYSVGHAGQVVLVRCDRIRVENLNLSRTSVGVLLWGTNNSIVSGNTIAENKVHGMWLYSSSNNSMNGNVIEGNNAGIFLHLSSGHNSIDRNNITNNSGGIWLDFSSNNSINRNGITNNGYGIALGSSSNNIIFHNNFVNNTVQVISINNNTAQAVSYAPEYANFWDNGCQGNYWSNYIGTDLDNDGVGDTGLPWEGVDKYPLMNVYWNPCDINHDLKVDIQDISVSTKAFYTFPEDAMWNPHANINGPETFVSDGRVDMKDTGIIARHFGERYP